MALPKHIGLVQVNFQQGPKEINAHYLPYSVGMLWAYAQSDPVTRDLYRLKDIIWQRDNIESVVRRIEQCDVVAFSTYVWNRNYNYALARKLRARNPDCLIVFGGPEPPITDPEIFRRYPFMDVVVKQEGEVAFRDVLKWRGTRASGVPGVRGLLVNHDGTCIDTGEPTRIVDLDTLPSPYLSGVFDDIVREHPGVEWNATLETNRGCPYQCTFCDWGSLTYNKVKAFDLERVFAEIDWIGSNGCGYISIADANFGIFPDRDRQIMDRILSVQNRTGHPSHFTVNWAKNQKAEIVEIVKRVIHNSKMRNQGLTISVQSLNDSVLETIKRKNLEISKIEKIIALCDQQGIPVNTEVILGLPGETLATWKENFWRLFRAGQHTGIAIYQAQLLENAEMNLAQKKKYGIEESVVYDYMHGSYNDDELKEGVSIVTATKDMPYAEMLDAHVFNWFINTFHISGLTNFVSRFLATSHATDYSEFYGRLFDRIQSNAWLMNEAKEIRHYYDKWMRQGINDHPNLGGIEIHGWNLITRSIIEMHASDRYDEVFSIVESLLGEFGLDRGIERDLMALQANYVVRYRQAESYPRVLEFSSNLYDHIIAGDTLARDRAVRYQFDFIEDKRMKSTTFLENLYFGRRKNFGKASINRV